MVYKDFPALRSKNPEDLMSYMLKHNYGFQKKNNFKVA
jgi:hypothetical protein